MKLRELIIESRPDYFGQAGDQKMHARAVFFGDDGATLTMQARVSPDEIANALVALMPAFEPVVGEETAERILLAADEAVTDS